MNIQGCISLFLPELCTNYCRSTLELWMVQDMWLGLWVKQKELGVASKHFSPGELGCYSSWKSSNSQSLELAIKSLIVGLCYSW